MFVWAVTIQSLKWHQGQEEFRYQVQDSRSLSTSNHKPLLSYSFVYKAEEFHFYLLCECDMGFLLHQMLKRNKMLHLKLRALAIICCLFQALILQLR